ncbi:MAG: hypothetical protein ACRDO8_03890, partial [Nocardioidaceae bacterium]
ITTGVPDVARRRALVRDRAETQQGVMSRSQLYALGLTRAEVRAEIGAGRWHRLGRQTVFVLDRATIENPPLAKFWWAVFEVGADAAIDGVSALIAAGLEGYRQDVIQVSVSKSERYSRPKGVRVYETRRRQPGDVVGAGLPRVHPYVGAVRGALWAQTRRQAALVLIMTVQQRLARAVDVTEAFGAVRRHRWRRFLRAVLADVTDGVQAMGELDFARACRRRGLPEPDRQQVRKGRGGRVYLDVRWTRWGVVAEIEGIQHEWASAQIPDTLRQNDVTIDGDALLRVPVLGFRDRPDPYLDQVEAMLRKAGWSRPVQRPAPRSL